MSTKAFFACVCGLILTLSVGCRNCGKNGGCASGNCGGNGPVPTYQGPPPGYQQAPTGPMTSGAYTPPMAGSGGYVQQPTSGAYQPAARTSGVMPVNGR